MPLSAIEPFLTDTNTCPSATITKGAIGIFDSGVGGLSITKCIAQHLPNENLIYIADSLYAPYGDKPVEFIVERVNVIADSLIKKGVKAIVIACNTATVNAVVQLRARLNIPVIGVEPAIKPAALHSKSKKVAVLVTQATADNLRFQQLIATHSGNVEVTILPCPGLVELIENTTTLYKGLNLNTLLKQYITPLLSNNIDTLVLGCTHYPFLREQILAITGNKLNIMETALPVTKQLIRMLSQHGLLAPEKKSGEVMMLSSNASEKQQALMSSLWQMPVNLQAL